MKLLKFPDAIAEGFFFFIHGARTAIQYGFGNRLATGRPILTLEVSPGKYEYDIVKIQKNRVGHLLVNGVGGGPKRWAKEGKSGQASQGRRTRASRPGPSDRELAPENWALGLKLQQHTLGGRRRA